MQGTKHLDLGSGNNIRNPYGAEFLYGTDITLKEVQNLEKVYLVPADLTKPLPFDTSHFDSISAFDLLEHIPRWERVGTDIRYPFIELLSEIFRILKPGGYFTAVTPAIPFPEVFQDPTHINFISENTIDYFISENSPATSLGYGFQGNFEKVHQSWLKGAGPFESLDQRIEPGLNSVTQFIDLFRFLNRSRKIIFRRKSHLLWVLKALK